MYTSASESMMRLAGRISPIPRFIHRLSGKVYSPELAQLPVFTRVCFVAEEGVGKSEGVCIECWWRAGMFGEGGCRCGRAEYREGCCGHRRWRRLGGLRRQNFDHGTETPTSDRPFSSTLSTNYQALLRGRQWGRRIVVPVYCG